MALSEALVFHKQSHLSFLFQTCSYFTRIKQVEHIDMEEMCDTYLNNSLPLVLTKQDVYRNAKMTVKDIIKVKL